MMILRSLLLLTCLQFKGGQGDFIDDEGNLRAALLGNYSSDVRPDFQVSVTMWCSLISLNYLDIALQIMSVNMIVGLSWYDTRLQWNSSAYGGLDDFVTAPEHIWTPPLVIENAVANVGVIGGKEKDGVPVKTYNNGLVTWNVPIEAKTFCEMVISHYPFDTQTCDVTLIGWTYPLAQLNITVRNVGASSLYSAHGEFDLVRTASYMDNIIGGSEKNVFRKIRVEFTFRRKWLFYGQNLLMPIVLNSILMNAVFLLPIESGEKMGYSLTVLLSYIVFLTWVTENLPPVSTDTSILQVYLAVVLCMGCLATLLTTWVLHLYHKKPEQPMRKFYRQFAVSILAPFHNLTGYSKKKDRENGDGGFEPTHQGNTKVLPMTSRRMSGTMTSRRMSLTSSKPAWDGIFQGGVEKGMHNSEVMGEDAGTYVSEGEATPTYTWQELAVLFDYFFLCFFAISLVVVTTVVFACLYAGY